MARKHEVQTVGVVVTMVSFVMLPVFLVGALSLQIRQDIAITAAQFGLVASIFFLVSAVASIPLGRAAQRWGPIKSLRVAGVLALSGYLGIGLVVQSWRSLFVFLGIVGCANALAQPAGNLAIARGVSKARGLAFGVKQAAVPIATLIAGVAVPVAATLVPWRSVFITVGFGAVITGFFASVVTELPAEQIERRTKAVGQRTTIVLFPLIMLSIGGALAAAAVNALGIFFVPAAVSIGWQEISAGQLLATASFLSIAMRVVVGGLADRFKSDGLLWVASFIAVGAVTFFMLGFSEFSLFYAAVFILAFGVGWGWPGLFQFAVAIKNENQTAVAAGIVQAGVWVGGVVGPLSFGLIAERFGFATAFFAGAVLQVISVGFIVYAKRRYQQLGM